MQISFNIIGLKPKVIFNCRLIRRQPRIYNIYFNRLQPSKLNKKAAYPKRIAALNETDVAHF